MFQIPLVFVLALCLWLPGTPLYAQGPAISYNDSIKTIFIGSNTGVPGSQVVQLSAVAAAVPESVLINQGGIWLSRASIVVESTAKLEIRQSDGVTELHLESFVDTEARERSITFIQVR
ncbi:MAG: hypothetical protein KDE19_09165, partial [Caldilineaceae bacterium]|nr:hypothetical protein [Caldilineaceae bacterium]